MHSNQIKSPSLSPADNSLFSSENDSDSVESKENGTPVKPKTEAAPKQVPAGGGGGLFDDDDDDDFFTGKSLKKSSPGKWVRIGPHVLQSRSKQEPYS